MNSHMHNSKLQKEVMLFTVALFILFSKRWTIKFAYVLKQHKYYMHFVHL